MTFYEPKKSIKMEKKEYEYYNLETASKERLIEIIRKDRKYAFRTSFVSMIMAAAFLVAEFIGILWVIKMTLFDGEWNTSVFTSGEFLLVGGASIVIAFFLLPLCYAYENAWDYIKAKRLESKKIEITDEDVATTP